MMTSRDWRQLGKGLAFLSPWLIGSSVFVFMPIVLSFYFSLNDYPANQPPMYVGMDNYRDLLSDPLFFTAARNSLYYAALVVPTSIFVSLGLAILLNVKTRGQSVYRAIIFIPTLVPAVASAMVWMFLYNPDLGLINGVLRLLSLPAPRWLGTSETAMPSLAIMNVWGVGQSVVIFLAGLQDVPKEMYEAAEIDGAGIWGRLWHVTLPTISPVIFFNLITVLIGTFQVYTVPFIMTGGGPGRATYLLTMYCYDNAFQYMKLGIASGVAWLQLIIIVALTGLAFWTARRWVHYGTK